jgi:hypothetical protein
MSFMEKTTASVPASVSTGRRRTCVCFIVASAVSIVSLAYAVWIGAGCIACGGADLLRRPAARRSGHADIAIGDHATDSAGRIDDRHEAAIVFPHDQSRSCGRGAIGRLIR